jgi:hypothetical protein
MCGLSGIVVTDPSLIPIEMMKVIFSLLMEENDDRGGHSWGAWGSGITPVRGLGRYFSNPTPLHEHLEKFTYQPEGLTYLFGHTRFGTHGEKSIDNAHPFEVGNLVLAHNGVVSVEGYTEQDHAVDSGRIAQAIVANGWEGGMAKVEGMCSLLVTVENQPLIYRHEQVLNYATFPWGTVISSTLYDLEAVIKKRMGLVPLEIGSVPEDVFCQPGFGDINQIAPAKKRAPYVAATYTGRSRWWEEEEDDQFSNFPYERGNYYGGCARSNEPQKTIGFAQNFSGKSDLPASKTEQKPTSTVKQIIHRGPNQPAIIVDTPDVMSTCDYCGYNVSIDDLSICLTEWGGDDPMVMCLDCIMDEIATNGKINVLGVWGSTDTDVRDCILVDVPDTEMDMLSASDKAELDEYIQANYRRPIDV